MAFTFPNLTYYICTDHTSYYFDRNTGAANDVNEYSFDMLHTYYDDTNFDYT